MTAVVGGAELAGKDSRNASGHCGFQRCQPGPLEIESLPASASLYSLETTGHDSAWDDRRKAGGRISPVTPLSTTSHQLDSLGWPSSSSSSCCRAFAKTHPTPWGPEGLQEEAGIPQASKVADGKLAEDVHLLFDLFDVNGDGMITRKEFRRGMAEGPVSVGPSVLHLFEEPAMSPVWWQSEAPSRRWSPDDIGPLTETRGASYTGHVETPASGWRTPQRCHYERVSDSLHHNDEGRGALCSSQDQLHRELRRVDEELEVATADAARRRLHLMEQLKAKVLADSDEQEVDAMPRGAPEPSPLHDNSSYEVVASSSHGCGHVTRPPLQQHSVRQHASFMAPTADEDFAAMESPCHRWAHGSRKHQVASAPASPGQDLVYPRARRLVHEAEELERWRQIDANRAAAKASHPSRARSQTPTARRQPSPLACRTMQQSSCVRNGNNHRIRSSTPPRAGVRVDRPLRPKSPAVHDSDSPAVWPGAGRAPATKRSEPFPQVSPVRSKRPAAVPGGAIPDLSAIPHLPNGMSLAEIPAGNVYMGFRNKNGEREGFGVMRGRDHSIYAGQWAAGRRHGHGTLFFEAGVFEGQWSAGNANGKGIIYFKSGDVFSGDYVDNKKCGRGTYRWADGAEENGDYENGSKQGWHMWHRGQEHWNLQYRNGKVVQATKTGESSLRHK